MSIYIYIYIYIYIKLIQVCSYVLAMAVDWYEYATVMVGLEV